MAPFPPAFCTLFGHLRVHDATFAVVYVFEVAYRGWPIVMRISFNCTPHTRRVCRQFCGDIAIAIVIVRLGVNISISSRLGLRIAWNFLVMLHATVTPKSRNAHAMRGVLL